MNIRVFYKLLILIGLLISCTNHQTNLATIISEDAIEENSIEKLFNIEKTKLMFLEQDSNVVLGKIEKMVSYNGDYFVLSRCGNNLLNLYRYNSDGKFINKVGTIGGASNEYVLLSTFFIQDNKVYVIDSCRNKMLVYSIDGTYIQSIKGKDDDFSFVLDAVAINNENVLLYNGLNTEPCVLFSIYNIPKMKITNEILTDISASSWGYYSNKRLAKNSTGAFFFLPFDKGIYTLDDDYSQKKIFQVNYLGDIPNFSSTQYDEIEQIIHNSDVSLFYSLFALDNKILINFIDGSIIWDISNHCGNFIPHKSDFTDNIFPFEGLYVKCTTENGFIAVIDEDSFKVMMRGHNPCDLFDNNEKEIQCHLYDGSPVIVRYYLN